MSVPPVHASPMQSVVIQMAVFLVFVSEVTLVMALPQEVLDAQVSWMSMLLAWQSLSINACRYPDTAFFRYDNHRNRCIVSIGCLFCFSVWSVSSLLHRVSAYPQVAVALHNNNTNTLPSIVSSRS